ncbi:beta-ketoacyl synthase chain length factor [Kushneria indalinina]|uniref:Beta-ketoacyl synthase-like protein n=1 Tax=Kushneria indalinina DSM 14324 TaxID=1122140 RepID=A0A3D9DU63_9GAMM|nr:beta-ketoacyl synthase chain length factor [Kushneria indalinina]REC94185.1 beta-ketoacyl synthase-like protein [Kushneria indalinina DSM 14324]
MDCLPHADTALPTLYLNRWRAWLPERAGEDVPACVITDEKPPAPSVPALLRRRLTPLGRAVCTLLGEMSAHERTTMPILHASRHGDGHRPLDMLDTLFEGEPLSPARFGLSVHNAVLGVYSIAFDNHASMAALAAAGEEFEALLSEARGYLAEGCDSVMLILTDSPVPERYRIQTQAPQHPSAILMELSLSPAPDAVCLQARAADTTDEPAQTITPPLLTDWLMGGSDLIARTPVLRWQAFEVMDTTPAG